MIREERYRTILSLLEKKETVKVSELAELLNVTEMTIRRDLQILEDEGLLDRVHGGARKKGNHYIELSNMQKETLNVEEKKHIGKICAELIEENDTIFISSGTTGQFILEYLESKHVMLVTNSISIFQKAVNLPNVETILTGGRYRKKTGTLIGYFANKLLSEIKINKCFIGTNGISGEDITTANEEEGYGLQTILNNSIERYIIADHTKFGVLAFFTFYNVKDVHGIITDPKINPHIESYYNDLTKIIK